MLRPFRLTLLAATALAVALPASGHTVLLAQETRPDFTWEGQVAPQGWLRIQNLNGSIRVEESTSGKAEVTARKRVQRGGDPNDVRIEMKKVGPGEQDVLVCALWFEDSTCDERGYHSHDHNRNSDVSVEFLVKLPKGTRVKAQTVNGSLNISGATAEVEAGTVNGSIDAASSGGPVNASTVNGSVNVRMGALGTEDLDFSTVNGSVTVELPAALDADLELSTVNGRLTSDYPMTVSGRIDPRHLRATIGKGGRQLKVSTVNGSVRLIKRG